MNDGPVRVVTIRIGWLALALALVLVALLVRAIRRPPRPPASIARAVAAQRFF